MTMLTNLTQRIGRSPGDPKVEQTGPSSLTSADKLARSLGMFSIGLGLIELIAPERITRAIGLDGKEGRIRAFGARELGSAVPTISIDKQAGLVMRILGDGLDLATVAPALGPENEKRRNAGVAFAMLIGITALDVIALVTTTTAHKRSAADARDYSDRSGLPRGVEASRGLARSTFQPPPDMHTPGTVAEQLSPNSGANGATESLQPT